MNTSEKIRMLCEENNLSITDLARLLKTTRQNLSNKLKRNNFPEKDLDAISKALGCEFESHFIKKNGDKI